MLELGTWMVLGAGDARTRNMDGARTRAWLEMDSARTRVMAGVGC